MKKLYLTYCSAKKRSGVHFPDRLYISGRITRFIDRCKSRGVDWAILSALYGFVFPDEEKENYDVTLRTDKKYWLDIAVIKNQQKLSYLQSQQHLIQLIRTIRDQTTERSINKIVLYGPSPKMMKCYLKILHFAFRECSLPHSWRELIEHVNKSRNMKVIHRIDCVLSLKEKFSRLAEFTQEIIPKAKFEDLILPNQQKKQLRDIITFETQRNKFYETWNIRKHTDTGLGNSVLFTGAYDRGKTMAAEVLAK